MIKLLWPILILFYTKQLNAFMVQQPEPIIVLHRGHITMQDQLMQPGGYSGI